MGALVASLIVFFLAGVIAQRLELYALLKLYPLQLAHRLPAMLLFLFVPAWFGLAPVLRFGRIVWPLMLAGTLWLVFNRDIVDVVRYMPGNIVFQFCARSGRGRSARGSFPLAQAVSGPLH